MFMTSEPLGNFHQSERMYRVLRSVGCMELLQNGKFLADCAQNVCQVFRAEYCSLNSLKRSKRLFLLSLSTGFGESLVFQMAPLVHAKITRLRWICSESSNNWDILSSEPVSLMEAQTNRFLRKFGTSAGLIREDKAPDLKIEKGECSVVLSSPESFSRNRRVGGEGFRKNC